jgi:hypothetical protein
LVKDRLEGTGMRWTVNGAQAMLHLRAIHLNGCWDEWHCRIVFCAQIEIGMAG